MTRKPKPKVRAKIDPKLLRLMEEDGVPANQDLPGVDEESTGMGPWLEEDEDLIEHSWRPVVEAAIKRNGTAFPALDLFLRGIWCPPLARRALEDAVRRRLAGRSGVRPAFRAEEWKKLKTLEFYDQVLKEVQDEVGRKRGRAHEGRPVSEEAKWRAAEKLNPADPSSAVDKITELLKRRKRSKGS